MHTDKYYNPETDSLIALNDVKEWVGTRRFNEIRNAIMEMEDTEQNRQFISASMAMGGVQGYPVGVMIDTYIGKSV